MVVAVDFEDFDGLVGGAGLWVLASLGMVGVGGY